MASADLDPDEVNDIYHQPSFAEAFLDSIQVEDPNPNTGQTYPGFAVDVTPYLPDA